MIHIVRIFQPSHPLIADALQRGRMCFLALDDAVECGALICGTTTFQGQEALEIEVVIGEPAEARTLLLKHALLLQHGLGLAHLLMTFPSPKEIALLQLRGFTVNALAITGSISFHDQPIEEKRDEPRPTKKPKKRRDRATDKPPVKAAADESDAATPILEEPIPAAYGHDPDTTDIAPAKTVSLSAHSRYTTGRVG